MLQVLRTRLTWNWILGSKTNMGNIGNIIQRCLLVQRTSENVADILRM
jgi:hypothetical protein